MSKKKNASKRDFRKRKTDLSRDTITWLRTTSKSSEMSSRLMKKIWLMLKMNFKTRRTNTRRS
jgi:hypothetical protein